jgi:hypothetical protein
MKLCYWIAIMDSIGQMILLGSISQNWHLSDLVLTQVSLTSIMPTA